MPFPETLKNEINDYCKSHLADETWYNETFRFIEEESLRKRIIEEFKAIRFAYKLYEGLGATEENLIFEVRYQILAYATIYEAVIHYVLYNYYQSTAEFHNMQYHTVPTRLSFCEKQMADVKKVLSWKNEPLYIYHDQERKKDETQVRFDDKCRTAERLGLIKVFTNDEGENVDLPAEIIEIYGYRNAIHIIAEKRKGIKYELNLSKLAYRRMQPFINQITEKLKADKKSVYK